MPNQKISVSGPGAENQALADVLGGTKGSGIADDLGRVMALFTSAVVASAAVTGSSTGTLAQQTGTITGLTGVTIGDICIPFYSVALAAGWAIVAQVTTSDTGANGVVSWWLINTTSGTLTPASGTIKVVVLPAAKFYALLPLAAQTVKSGS